MNRQNDISEMIKKSFIEATKKMSDDDRRSFYQAVLDDDENSQNEILKKYNILAVKPVEYIINDDEAKKLAKSILKSDKNKINEINDFFELAKSEFFSKEARLCDIPLDQHEKIIEHVRCLQASFDSKKYATDIFNGLYGENATTIIKAVLVADVVGCMSLRNELLILFSSMVEDAYLEKVFSIVNSNMVISKEQSERASKPRNPYYSEVMEVIRLTWESYPKGSSTKLLNELSKHYENKVSRNSLSNWISGSGLKPLKPEKYTDLQLVFPH